MVNYWHNTLGQYVLALFLIAELVLLYLELCSLFEISPLQMIALVTSRICVPGDAVYEPAEDETPLRNETENKSRTSDEAGNRQPRVANLSNDV